MASSTVEREYRDAIQRPARRHHARGRDQPEARLQPDDVVEHRRHPAASRGVGAERQRHQAGRYRHRRARTRSARNEIAAHRIAGDAIGRAHADQTGGELVEIGLADDDGAGRAQSGDGGGVVRRRIGKGRAGGGGRQARGVDIVLHRDRDAVERQPRRHPFRQRFGFRQRVLFVAQADEDGGIVVVADPRKAARDSLRGRHRAGAMRGDDLGDGFSHGMPRSERRTHSAGAGKGRRPDAKPWEGQAGAESSPSAIE